MSLDPTRAECLGLYGYGIGYLAHETRVLARLNGGAEAFCDRCPKRVECWQQHRERISSEQPLETAAFTAAVDQAKAAGDDQAGGRIAAKMMVAGTPDPWMNAMLQNIQRGLEERQI